MKYKVSELEGALLDAAVAKAEGHQIEVDNVGPVMLIDTGKFKGRVEPAPWSSSWAYGGPLIQREDLYVYRVSYSDESLREWASGHSRDLEDGGQSCGPTPLIAAMRAFVASKFGDEVDL
jgi:hypothetical protein